MEFHILYANKKTGARQKVTDAQRESGLDTIPEGNAVDDFRAPMSGEHEISGYHRIGWRRALQLLDPLRATPTGELTYQQVSRILAHADATQANVEKSYSGLISTLLRVYASQLTPGSLLQVQLILLEKLLQPPLSADELAYLVDHVNSQAASLEQLAGIQQFDAEDKH